jgi:hypothetical protein
MSGSNRFQRPEFLVSGIANSFGGIAGRWCAALGPAFFAMGRMVLILPAGGSSSRHRRWPF